MSLAGTAAPAVQAPLLLPFENLDCSHLVDDIAMESFACLAISWMMSVIVRPADMCSFAPCKNSAAQCQAAELAILLSVQAIA